MSTKPKANEFTLLRYSERIKLVRERLTSLRHFYPKSLAKPAKVAAAEKVVQEWEQKNFAHEDAQRDAHRAKLHAVQDALILGDVPKALALLQKAEQK